MSVVATEADLLTRSPGGLAPGSGTPVVIAHRGASGRRPEHTLAAYALAARMGADYLEPDLVSTRDHVLVARHENEISGTTDVADRPEFAGRRTIKEINGYRVRGWFTEDFTLAELRTLRARERLPQLRTRNVAFDGQLQVPTLEEILTLREELVTELGRPVGVYPEAKSPTYFRSVGLDLETPLLACLRGAGLDRPQSPAIIQCFEPTTLVRLRSAGARMPLVLLANVGGTPFDLRSTDRVRSYAELTSAEGLRSIADVVTGIGPDKHLVIPRHLDGSLAQPTSLVGDAHDAGLVVHPWTFRAENCFLPTEFRIGDDEREVGRAVEEQVAYLRAGVDGVFTDHTDHGVAARLTHSAGTPLGPGAIADRR